MAMEKPYLQPMGTGGGEIKDGEGPAGVARKGHWLLERQTMTHPPSRSPTVTVESQSQNSLPLGVNLLLGRMASFTDAFR